jgi:hypothetical protein
MTTGSTPTSAMPELTSRSRAERAEPRLLALQAAAQRAHALARKAHKLSEAIVQVGGVFTLAGASRALVRARRQGCAGVEVGS